jgi:hypothetical protein
MRSTRTSTLNRAPMRTPTTAWHNLARAYQSAGGSGVVIRCTNAPWPTMSGSSVTHPDTLNSRNNLARAEYGPGWNPFRPPFRA